MSEWLPRVCPRCAAVAVIGHGRRTKPAHDEHHTRILVRRAICNRCGQTITVLPAWSLPYSHYSVPARQQALQRCVEEGAPLEESAPATQDPDRVADARTVCRWLQRRWCSLRECAATLALSGRAAAAVLSPTIFAWDWLAASRILFPEREPG